MILQKQDRTKSGRKRHTTKREFNCQSLPVTLSHQVHNSLLFCMSDPRPSLLSQSGCTRRYFVFSQACSFIYNPTPPFNSQPTQLFALLQSGNSQKLILVTQLAGPPQVIFSTQQIKIKIKWTYFRLLFILRLQRLYSYLFLPTLFCKFFFSGMFVISFRVHSRLPICFFYIHNFLFLLLVVVL